jgi:hypothetical protein
VEASTAKISLNLDSEAFDLSSGMEHVDLKLLWQGMEAIADAWNPWKHVVAC